MTDIEFGDYNRRQLTIRFWPPFEMEDWSRYPASVFSWRKLLNPLNWWRAIRRRDSWAWDAQTKPGTGRCYCPSGSFTDARLVVAVFGVWIWYSEYAGTVPCPCDITLAELDAA